MAQSGPWFVVALLALLAPGLVSAAVASEAADDAGAQEPVLHLRGDPEGDGLYRNYTTQAPQNNTSGHVEPCEVLQRGEAQWCWQMNRAPEPWTLEAGANVQAIVHFANLDRVPVGIANPDDPLESGKLRIDAVLTKGSYKEAARGTAYLEPSAVGDNAEARVTIAMDVPEETQWNTTPGDAPAVELQIHLHGLVRRDDPPTITTGAVDVDSRLVLPGFPLEAFQAWEENESMADACMQRLIQQEQCEQAVDPLDNATRSLPGASAEAPVHVLPLLFVLVAALLVRRRKRHPA